MDYIRAGYGQVHGGLRRQAGDDLRAGLASMCVARERRGGACEQMRARHTLYLYLCRDENTPRRRTRAGGGCESVFGGMWCLERAVVRGSACERRCAFYCAGAHWARAVRSIWG